MPKKSVLVAILSLALLVGAVVSGCNRNRDDSVASANSRRRSAKQHELSSVRNVRPAEVLSASAYRPQVRRKPAPPARPQYNNNYNGNYNQYDSYSRSQPQYSPAPSYQAPAYEPLPEPVPVSQLAVNPSSFGASGSYYAPVTYTPTAYSSETYTQPVTQDAYYASQSVGQSRTNDPYSHLPEYAYKPQRKQQGYVPPAVGSRPQAPDLAMARAHLDRRAPAQQPAESYGQRVPIVKPVSSGGGYNYRYNDSQVPPVEPSQFAAPIPELEPVRYQRVANSNAPAAPRIVPQVPVMTSSRAQRQQQAQPVQQRQQQQRVRQVAGYQTRDAQEVQRALAPLEQENVRPASQDWVSSAASSMYW